MATLDREAQARQTGARFVEALRPILAASTVLELNTFMAVQHGTWPPSRLLKCEVCDLVLDELVPLRDR